MALVAMAFMVVATAALKTMAMPIRAVLQLGAVAVVVLSNKAPILGRGALLLMVVMVALAVLLERLAPNPGVVVVLAKMVTQALVLQVA